MQLDTFFSIFRVFSAHSNDFQRVTYFLYAFAHFMSFFYRPSSSVHRNVSVSRLFIAFTGYFTNAHVFLLLRTCSSLLLHFRTFFSVCATAPRGFYRLTGFSRCVLSISTIFALLHCALLHIFSVFFSPLIHVLCNVIFSASRPFAHFWNIFLRIRTFFQDRLIAQDLISASKWRSFSSGSHICPIVASSSITRNTSLAVRHSVLWLAIGAPNVA